MKRMVSEQREKNMAHTHTHTEAIVIVIVIIIVIIVMMIIFIFIIITYLCHFIITFCLDLVGFIKNIRYIL